MAYSYVRYTGNGTTANYTFAFPYISADHVKVNVDGVAAVFTFLNANTVTVMPTPSVGSVVEIKRVTPKSTAIVNFTDGSVLLERDLDLLATFDLYIAQEADDAVEQSIKQDSLGVFQAQSKRIANVADPVNAQDAATKHWVETTSTGFISTAAASVAAAQAAATSSQTSATASATSATASANSATLAGTYATSASNSETAAATSASQAAASATTASTAAQVVVDNNDEIQAIGNNIDIVKSVGGDLAGTGWSFDLGSVTDPATGAGTAPPGYIRTVYNDIDDIKTVAGDLAGTGFSYDLGSVNDPVTSNPSPAGSVRTVSENITAINTVSTNVTSVNTVSTNIASVNTAASNITAIQNAPTAAANAASSATAAASSASSASTSATSASSSATTASSSASSASTSATNAASSATAAASSATSASGSATTATTQATAASSSASSASTSASNASTSATNAANSATAAALSLFNFKGQYYGPLSSDPTVDGNGNAVTSGDLYFNTATSLMKIYNGSAWQNVGAYVNGTASRFRYIATAGQTTFSGNDSKGNSLLYDAGFIDVYLNGILLDSSDYTATSGTSIVLAAGATVSDELNIVAFGTFSVASVNGTNITDNTVGINKLTSTLDLGALP